jgi:hypothetical protein
MISYLNTSARVIVLHRPLKTEMEDDFSTMAFFIRFTVKLYEKCLSSIVHQFIQTHGILDVKLYVCTRKKRRTMELFQCALVPHTLYKYTYMECNYNNHTNISSMSVDPTSLQFIERTTIKHHSEFVTY